MKNHTKLPNLCGKTCAWLQTSNLHVADPYRSHLGEMYACIHTAIVDKMILKSAALQEQVFADTLWEP